MTNGPWELGVNRWPPVISRTARSGGSVRLLVASRLLSRRGMQPAFLPTGATSRMKRRWGSSPEGSTPALADAPRGPSETVRGAVRCPHARKRPDVHGSALQRIGPVVVSAPPGRSFAAPSTSPRARHVAAPENPFAKVRAPPGTDADETCEGTTAKGLSESGPRH